MSCAKNSPASTTVSPACALSSAAAGPAAPNSPPDARQIHDLAACRWVAHGENLLLLGPPGVGKTHLGIALGREAILAGYSILCEGQLEEKLAHFAKPKLLIVDELATCRSRRTRRTCSSS